MRMKKFILLSIMLLLSLNRATLCGQDKRDSSGEKKQIKENFVQGFHDHGDFGINDNSCRVLSE